MLNASTLNTVTRKRAVAFFRSLADENRLRIIGLVAGQERSVEELAAMLDLKAPTVSHHLTGLKQLGLVQMRAEGTTHYYRLDLESLRVMCRETLAPEQIVTFGDDVAAEAWENQVLKNFFDGERLKEIPSSLKKRQPVLKWLATRFEPGVRYPEAEVNGILQRHHPDCAALRRYLIEDGYLRRDHGVYWRDA
jgi:DNA-binding transcriptional ArsR family regulator